MNDIPNEEFSITKTCKQCGSKFKIYTGADKSFCNQKCYNKHWRKNNPQKINAFRQRRGLSNRSARHLDKYLRHIDPMIEVLGCTIPEFKIYLESKFLPGMTWKNHTVFGWHIDHIRPCCAFDLTKPEDQKKCFHFTNLRPLWWRNNLSKNGKHTKMPVRKPA